MPPSKMCINCGKAGLERYYVRVTQIGKTRMFESVNLFQCPSCFAFFAYKNRHLIMLEIREIERKPADILNSSLIRRVVSDETLSKERVSRSPSPEGRGGD